MTTTTTTNGRARKSLADQLDRLDGILDGLSEALNEAVATAVRDAVKEAVQEAVAATVHEVLTNEQLQRRLRELREPPTPPPAPKQSGRPKPLLEKAGEACRQAAAAVRQAVGNAADAVRSTWCEATLWVRRTTGQAADQARAGCETLGNLAAVAWHYRQPLLVALAVGTAAGITCYLAGPVGPAVACGAASALGSLAASAWGRVRRLLPGTAVASE
jgi:hypothetical protein